MVVLVDEVLRAYAYDVSKELSIFIGLITQTVRLWKIRSTCLGNGVWRSFLDGVGNAFGYGAILYQLLFLENFLVQEIY